MTHNEKEQTTKQTAKPPEETYETPRLTALGSLVDITHGPDLSRTGDEIFGGIGGFQTAS